VYSVEIIDELAQRAVQRLKRQGCTNVGVRVANGYAGWPKHAPFDKVMVTAAPDLIPPPLINQLKAGGRMVIPVGLLDAQQLERRHTCQADSIPTLSAAPSAHPGPSRRRAERELSAREAKWTSVSFP
jgi:protein-L-isoaspartate(D-aspartate) O-methyltransferase